MVRFALLVSPSVVGCRRVGASAAEPDASRRRTRDASSRFASVTNRYLAEADPAYYYANKAIMFGHGVQYRERPPEQQSKVSRISKNFDLDQSLEPTINLIKQARGRSLEPDFPCRTSRRPFTAAPSSIRRIIWSSNSGGSWRSASMIKIRVPRVH
jgi:hypothetical protein